MSNPDDMTGTAGQPTEAELQAMLEQMREADPAEIIAQAFQILAMGAEVKLGRSDARVLIDTIAAVTESSRGRVEDQLSTGMANAVRQLQMAQVQAERQAGQQADEATGDQAGRTGATGGERPSAQTPPDPQGGQDPRMTNRLWIPGR